MLLDSSGRPLRRVIGFHARVIERERGARAKTLVEAVAWKTVPIEDEDEEDEDGAAVSSAPRT